MWGGPRLTASRRADRIPCTKLRAHGCLPCSTCGLLRSHWELVRDPPWAWCLVNSHLCVPIPHERRSSREEQSCVPHRAASIVPDIAPLFTQPVCIECLFALLTLEGLAFRGSFPWSCPGAFPLIWSVNCIRTRHLIAKSLLPSLCRGCTNRLKSAGLSGNELGLRLKEMALGSFNQNCKCITQIPWHVANQTWSQ